MKNLITGIACTVLLMAFVAQFAHNQVLFQQLLMVNYAVDAFQERVMTGAGVDKESVIWLKKEVGEIMECGADCVDVTIDGRQYEIRFPVTKVLASPSFWGIGAEENTAEYVILREISEREGETEP